MPSVRTDVNDCPKKGSNSVSIRAPANLSRLSFSARFASNVTYLCASPSADFGTGEWAETVAHNRHMDLARDPPMRHDVGGQTPQKSGPTEPCLPFHRQTLDPSSDIVHERSRRIGVGLRCRSPRGLAFDLRA
jgi:hypothetical protein